jgi:cytidylate kinase
MREKLVITIDGPAGAGKSTVSKVLAGQFSYLYLDTGALYRTFAYKVWKENIAPDDKDRLAELAKRIKIALENENGNLKILCGGKDVTREIRIEQISLLASKISAQPVVREALLSVQRDMGKNGGVIAEGRDPGTVIFPKADYKFFLDADIKERVNRRYKELIARGECVDFSEVKRDILLRDKQDREREVAPLKPAIDAIAIDTTNMTIFDVANTILKIIRVKEAAG